jgi:SAM-dependent methyltransferase
VNDTLLPGALSADTDQKDAKLARTHGHAMAAIRWRLQWQSEVARHSDSLVTRKLNFWRDILPPELETSLLDQPVGHKTSHHFAPGQLLPGYEKNFFSRAAERIFNRHYRACYIEPRAGRFYPKGFIAGFKGIFSGDLTPFRIASIADGQLTVDFNHPLADQSLTLTAQILDAWEAGEEHGGACQDIAEHISSNGPGMQSRWRGQATDFWSDLPFARADPTPDQHFYQKPRLVEHLDTVALAQIEALYARLIPENARILDLMASWSSHLPKTLQAQHIAGLGMNEAELAANPQLQQYQVQDLNQQSQLAYPDASFDAVVCTASIEYLTAPFQVFREVQRILKPSGRFIVTFSNRWFPPKVIKVWQEIHEFERMGLVLEYFLESGGFNDLETWSMRGLERPTDDKYAHQTNTSDPVYAVWGSKPA